MGKKKISKGQPQPLPVQQPTPPGSPSPEKHVNTPPKGGVQNATEEPRKVEKRNSKHVGKRKPKKSGFLRRLRRLFTFRLLLISYVLGVVFACEGKTREQCKPWPLEGFCYNGISQYILTHDLFHKYVEPGIVGVKHYSGQTYDVASSTYDTYAEPYVSPLLEPLQPHIQAAKDSSVNYAYTAQGLYDQHAKKHVDNYYDQAKKLVTPIFLQLQEYVIKTYTMVLKFNEKNVRPWYRKQIAPHVDQAKKYYHKKIVPFVKNAVKLTTEKYNEHVDPMYRTYVEPHFLKLWEHIKGLINPEAKRRADEENKRREAERKEKAEAELKARVEAEQEANRKAKEEEDARKAKEAAQKAKQEAEIRKAARKAKEEAERKAKEEAERKAKEEAERKAKEEADRKVKKEAEIRKAEEEEAARAERKEKEKAAAIKAVNDTAAAELPRYQRNILSATEKLIQSATQDTLNNIETELNIVKKSGAEHASKIESLVMDTEKDIDQKISTINEYVRQRLYNIKKITRESTKRAEDSLIKLNETFESGYQDITIKRLSETRTAIFGKADNQKKIGEKIVEEINIRILGITREIKKEFSMRINTEISKIKTKIESIKKVAREVGKDIVNIRESAIKSLKQQEKGDEQEPVSKDGSTANVKILSSDPVLEQLKIRYRLRRDPVLQKLKASYNARKKSVSSTEDEVEEEEDYEEEEDN